MGLLADPLFLSVEFRKRGTHGTRPCKVTTINAGD
jgi:hypothetical protein